jgi:hypothetical protein
LQSVLAQPDLNFQLERGRVMLRIIKDDLSFDLLIHVENAAGYGF